jgi:hypothetical protein
MFVICLKSSWGFLFYRKAFISTFLSIFRSLIYITNFSSSSLHFQFWCKSQFPKSQFSVSDPKDTNHFWQQDFLQLLSAHFKFTFIYYCRTAISLRLIINLEASAWIFFLWKYHFFHPIILVHHLLKNHCSFLSFYTFFSITLLCFFPF